MLNEIPKQDRNGAGYGLSEPWLSSLLIRDQEASAQPIREVRHHLQTTQRGIGGWIGPARLGSAPIGATSEGSVQPASPLLPRAHVVPPSLTRAKDLELAGEVALFREIMSDWGFSDEEASAILGYKEPSFATNLFSGLASIRQRDADERLRLVIAIAVDLEALYRDYDVIKKWLRKPHELLNGDIPLKMATEGTSHDLLKLSEYIEYLSGR